jgi:pimeloyl-ACP methyl ester carboxylesterase
MKRRKQLFVVGGLLSFLSAALVIIYVAYPRVLLRAVVAVQRSNAGVGHDWVQVQDWDLPWIDSQQQGKDNQETILLVHGFGDTKDSFLDLAAGLTDDYRIVALDLPGFGESAIRMDQDYSATFYVSVILDFLDQLDIDSVHLVGYSMGGMLAAKVASQSPDRVRTLTLLAPAGLQGDQPSEMDRIVAEGKGIPLTYRDRESFDRLMRLNFHQQLDVPDFAIRAVIAEGKERAELHELIFSKLFNAADRAAFEQQIAALKMPTVLIWGTEDRILDVSAADRWSQVNPDIRVVLLPEVGHDLIHQRIRKIHEELRAQIGAVATAQ